MRRQNLNRLKERVDRNREASKEGMMMDLNRLSGNKLARGVEVVGLGLEDVEEVEDGEE